MPVLVPINPIPPSPGALGGPCEWPALDLCCLSPSGTLPDPCLLNGTPVSQTILDSSVLAASQMLYSLTGRQFNGCCQVTVRPCRKSCDRECCIPSGFGFEFGFPFTPRLLSDGSWINVTCDCQDECSCVSLCEITLPSPICSIDEVKIDGIIVDPATYRVDDFNKLVRLGSDCFPQCNDLTKSDTEVGTWSVKLSYGRPPPELVLLAASLFACELIKSCVGQPCTLPQRIQSISRQGVSIGLLDPLTFLKDGGTGIYLVDLAIMTYNPNHLMRKPVVWSPDVANRWRVTNT